MTKLFCSLALTGFVVCANADIVFDSLSPTNGWMVTTESPHHLMGTSFSLGNVTSPVTITGIDFMWVNYSLSIFFYSNIQFDISFWGESSNAISGSDAAFSNRLASFTLNTGFTQVNGLRVYRFGASANVGPTATNLGDGFTFENINNLGVQILVRGDQGSGLVNSDALAMAITNSATGPTVGSFTTGNPGQFGHYTNYSQSAPSNADISLIGSDFAEVAMGGSNAGNNGMGFRLYSAPVPEPTTMAALGFGTLLFLKGRRKTAGQRQCSISN